MREGMLIGAKLFLGGQAAGSGECPQPLRLLDDLTGGKEGGEDKEVRTLWVDYDEHGDRYKRWRDLCKESYTPNFDQKP